MRTKLLSILALLLMTFTGAMAKPITIVWSSSGGGSFDERVQYSMGPYNIGINSGWILYGGGIFTTNLGNFTEIKIEGGNFANYVTASGWNGRTWTGKASSVLMDSSLSDNYGTDNFTITFTIEPINVSRVMLSDTEADMTLGGDALTLTVQVAPSDATYNTVTWTTSDSSVATVVGVVTTVGGSPDGVVTAVGAGTATITATATNGTDDTSDDKTATCTVTVEPPTYSITLAEGTEDAANWTIRPNPAASGETVTLTYAGTKTVKSIKVVKKEAAATAPTLAEVTAEDLGKIVGGDGNIYDTKNAAETAGTTAVAMIAYLPSSPEEATYTPGLAIALDDESSSDWSTANSTCEGKSAVANARWMLPSMYQWKAMFKAFGDNILSCTGLNTAITTAGGTAVEDEDATYWSSSEEDEDNAWMMSLWEGGASWSDVSKSFTFVNVRACLAFEVEAAPTEDYVEFNDGTNTVKVAKMNLGATTIAESASSCYGNYYAWAATTTSANYISNTAPYYDSSNWSYTKYTSTDGLATLEDGDEVVKANMPGWHMPTKAEFKTLYAACGGTGSYVSASSISSGASYAKGIYWVAGATSSITIGGDKYNVNGILFVQDANHHVFFPAAGDFYGSSTQDSSSLGYYWSSSLNTGSPDYAYYLYFTSSSVYPEADGGRYYGYTIRPFKD